MNEPRRFIEGIVHHATRSLQPPPILGQGLAALPPGKRQYVFQHQAIRVRPFQFPIASSPQRGGLFGGLSRASRTRFQAGD
jgi:hypothetical protein